MPHDAAGGSLDLHFDKALPSSGSAADSGGAVNCQSCQRTIYTEYFDVSGQVMCGECRGAVETLLQTPRGAGPLVKAGLFGLGAGIVGAIIYYAVIAITDFEIGIVAILIGYIVGYAVRKGAGGRGGRRFQVLAVALTYAAVALAYTPIAVKAALKDKAGEQGAATTSQSEKSQSAPSQPATPEKTDDNVSASSAVVALAMLIGLIAALPILVIVGTLPSGLISAVIIFFGLKQAWSMTGVAALQITGPYRVGAPAPAVSV